MKIKFFATVLALLLSCSAGLAQTIENASRSTIGYISSSGTIENASRSTIGYVDSDGSVENATRRRVFLLFL